MTPDTIITAEILAGLTKCPFCGASDQHVCEKQKIFDCDSGFTLGKPFLEGVEKTCLVTHERDNLRARVQELEEALNQIANQDYRGNRSVESRIAYAALKKGTK